MPDRGTLDRPSTSLQAILLKPSSQWTDEERDRIARRRAVEQAQGLGPSDENSILFGTNGETARVAENPTTVRGRLAAADEAIRGRLSGPDSGPRLGNPRAAATLDQFGARIRGEAPRELAPGNTITTPQRPPQSQTPGTNFVPNNPSIALTEAERAAGASVTIPQGVPRGTLAFQNAQGGFTTGGQNDILTAFATGSTPPTSPAAPPFSPVPSVTPGVSPQQPPFNPFVTAPLAQPANAGAVPAPARAPISGIRGLFDRIANPFGGTQSAQPLLESQPLPQPTPESVTLRPPTGANRNRDRQANAFANRFNPLEEEDGFFRF